MSRSEYSDDCRNIGLYRGSVERAIRGKRGQAFLLDLIAALDALPEKRLITEELIHDGDVCALGSVGLRRGIDMTGLDVTNADLLGGIFNIAQCMVREVEYMNDEYYPWVETPEQRWVRIRQWAVENLLASKGERCSCCGEGRDGCPLLSGASATCATGTCDCFRAPEGEGQ